MAKAAAKKKSRSTTVTSYSEQIVATRTPSDILELGKALVQEMGLDDDTDTLGRWMCHHVASLIAEAANDATNATQKLARDEAVETILLLWDKRTALPGNGYPLARYKGLLRCLAATSPDASIWEGRDASSLDDLARTLFTNLTGIVNIVLSLESRPPLFERRRSPVPPISITFLKTLEQKLLMAAEELDDRTLELLSGLNYDSTKSYDPKKSSLAKLLKVIESTQANLRSLGEQVSKELESPAKTEESKPESPSWNIVIAKRLSTAQQDQCLEVLRAGGAVDVTSARKGLGAVSRIALVKSSGMIVGLAALKGDRPAYTSKIARASGSSIEKNSLEVGYIAVLSEFRKMGLGTALLSELIANTDRALFATTSSAAMRKMLRRQGFRRTGKAWVGRTEKLSLWQRNAMTKARGA